MVKKEEILKINNLNVEFPLFGGIFQREVDFVHAVNDVTFTVKKGETIGIVGESGSGKSTLGKAILNVLKLTAPDVRVYGDVMFKHNNEFINILKQDRKTTLQLRPYIQMIFQDPYSSLNGRLKVKDIVSEPIKLHNPLITSKDIDSYIYDLLESVELTQQSAERYPHEFSGGQRQRISIARALATQPRLLVCDEPTSALDVSIQAQILNLLKDLQEQLNLTILFISHDLPVVRQMCDRIAVLKNGKLCENSMTEELFNNPNHEYTKELLQLMPKIESIYN